jgi:hypothetical protein
MYIYGGRSEYVRRHGLTAAGDVVDRKRFRLAGIGPTGGGILSRLEKLGRAN